jgi:hypothetical protein
MGWVVNATPRPRLPLGKDPVPIVKEAKEYCYDSNKQFAWDERN